jgi:hypothetical protein
MSLSSGGLGGDLEIVGTAIRGQEGSRVGEWEAAPNHARFASFPPCLH